MRCSHRAWGRWAEDDVMKPWVGRQFRAQNHRVLILGESWYGNFGASEEIWYIDTWIKRQAPGKSDRFFSRIFNSCNLKSAAQATQSERAAFWDSVAFTNLVSESVGDAPRVRPGEAHWKKGVRRLERLLLRLQCDRALILGLETSFYAKPVFDGWGIKSVSCPHPSGYGITKKMLQEKWAQVIQ